jgi:hypothetical protein
MSPPKANKNLRIDPHAISPLVGLDALPAGFLFCVNMYSFGGMRCYVAIPAECLSMCFEVLGVGQCPYLIHDAIHRQLHYSQTNFEFTDIEDLPVLIEIFSHYKCEWRHFDA